MNGISNITRDELFALRIILQFYPRFFLLAWIDFEREESENTVPTPYTVILRFSLLLKLVINVHS